MKVMILHRLSLNMSSATFPTMQQAALFSVVGSHSSRVSRGRSAGSSLIGQLVIEAGPEKPWVAVALHQAEDLILGQLERGGAKTQTQALTGRFSDSGVHVDLEGGRNMGQGEGSRDQMATSHEWAETCLPALVEMNSW